MTPPALAFGIRKRGRHYPWPPQPVDHLPRNQWGSVNPEDIPDNLTPLPSITNALGIIDKPALLGWAAEQALRDLYETGDLPDDVDEAISRHKYAHNKARNKRADAGTRAHTLAERLTTDQPLPASISDEDAAYADAFMEFWADHQPEPLWVEATVANPDVGYAGTGDLFARIGGRTVVLDYKTRGRPPKKKNQPVLYDENRAQLAALADAPYRFVWDDGEWAVDVMPQVDEGWGVVLYPDGAYGVEKLGAGELARCFEGFKGCLQTWRWLKGEVAA